MHHALSAVALVVVLAAAPPRAATAQGGSEAFDRRMWLEVGAVGATGAGHLAFSAVDQSRLFIPVAALGWAGYVAYRARSEPGFLTETGLGRRGLGPAFRDATLVAAGAGALMAVVGRRKRTLRPHRDMIPLLALYPVWGLVQQTLVQGMVTANLDRIDGPVGSPWAVTPVSALLFGAVHVPNWRLTAATTAMGLAYAPLYLAHGSLWPLGLYHGALGVLFYFWVLDRNPWQHMVRRDRPPRLRLVPAWSPHGRPALRLHLRL